jgi:hypothetical protein
MEFIYKNKKNLLYLFIIVILIIVILVVSKNSKNDTSTYNEKSYLHDYKENEVNYVYISEEDMANKYLSDYINLLINNPKEAYERLNQNYRANKFPSYESFSYYLQDLLSTQFLESKVSKYSVYTKDEFKYYDIIDGDNNNIIFKEISIMNYEVFLDNYTVK